MISFASQARAAASSWKERSPALPVEARAPGIYRRDGKSYPFVLPPHFAVYNLLPDARDWALQLFSRAGIPWHDGIDGGPSNHLLSSQVQCVNALAPLAQDPAAIRAIFSDALGIAEVLPIGDPFTPDGHLTFEWIGQNNVLGEWKEGKGTRGAMNTSADAAFRYLNHRGEVELAIVEWKYTEQYKGDKAELSRSTTSKATRDARYRHLFDDPDGPLLADVVPYDDLYVEPFYQLMRLSLLAWQTEINDPEITRVRLVYCAPVANTELWGSLNRPSHVGDVATLWQRMQRRPDRFVLFDTARFVAEDSPLSSEFKSRYRHLAGACCGSVNPA